MTRLFVLSWLLAPMAFGLGGCFKDTGGSGSASGSESGGCADGAEGCACYGNGSCDADLECDDDVCVPPGCEAGAEGCPCGTGELCFPPLECQDNVCVPPSGTSTTDTGDACNPDGAGACEMCLGTNCCGDVELCSTVEDCWCMLTCLAQFNSAQDCDEMCPPTNEFSPVGACMFDSCDGICHPIFSCTPSGGDFLCRECAKESCCDPYRECILDPQCRCYERCLGRNMGVGTCMNECGDIQGNGGLYLDLAQCTAEQGCLDMGATCYPNPP